MKGFKFAGICAGIKKNRSMDLGLIYSEKPACAAALFTQNQVVAAPVILGRKTMEKGMLQAILVNSGNANCFTGAQGIAHAEQCVELVAKALNIDPEHVLVSSTGVIGAPLPMDKIEAKIPEAVRSLDACTIVDFAGAILTTDTCTKMVSRNGTINPSAGNPSGDEKSFTIMGVAKGSGMIRPDMATMLSYILTDADISSSLLKQALTHAAFRSFNRITVDGDTSTNDTLVCMASGAGTAVIDNDESLGVFQAALDEVCYELAKKIVKDGEGATKVATITVKGALTSKDAFKAAEAIAHSPLVKTALYGQDPNWGRITAAAGRSGATVDQDKMDLYFDDVLLVQNGQWQGKDAEKKAAEVMKRDEINIVLDLNLGDGQDMFLFCDFSENYVKINADYRS
ncbi:ornithine acetyltransferase [Desulfobacter hydrogenophilus]|uniref:Arginine biosynthesis bifunctional protein ArgJ n=1 Tax=Desulfobacter hydrogenophilus TaxID=2291 RepID=A0A328FD13_9BACT|nr:bifunctional glutamate N-acetyltransferase/amino-acid acetyltransferase ArgJ [Desulfobacter hydrogenophilus]NDY73327.1 bifunctional glutamate N-acetyltransferase/amino-acid acetyltransferase ArgJ [Desulfobacter hydrogenophilus]QBH14068.1 bifunctional glutamate N-acetyltransferase/amino-acid acetyltransferase ArgJ [Desulfobacter hydrogenophilus]RAM01630.1 ornithine acetyltransferase [Desulfobacter hydrogenophilus]